MNAQDRKSGIIEFGVFAWDGNGNYRKEAAVKCYQSRAAAERFAAPRNLVVRGLDKLGRHALRVYEPAKSASEQRERDARRF